MGHHLIRHELNYGEVDVVELEGVRFVVPTWRLEVLKLQPAEAKEIPEFTRHLYLSVQLPNGVNDVMCHVLDKADVRKLAAALSRHTGMAVQVRAQAPAILAIYKDGQLQGEVRKLTHFYSGLTPEEISETTF